MANKPKGQHFLNSITRQGDQNMFRLIQSPKCKPHTGDGCACDCVMLTAEHIANTLRPAEARVCVEQLLCENCWSILGAGDRREILDAFFAARARLRGRFLEGTGLLPDPTIAGRILPGSWWMHRQPREPNSFVIEDVFALDGSTVSVPLKTEQFLSAGAVLRAIRRAVGAEGKTTISSTEWQRIWHSPEYEVGGKGDWVGKGLAATLLHDCLARGDRP